MVSVKQQRRIAGLCAKAARKVWAALMLATCMVVTLATPAIAATPQPSGTPELATTAGTSILAALPQIGLVEVLALIGAFLYGTATVFVVGTVHRDRRNQVPDEVLSIT